MPGLNGQNIEIIAVWMNGPRTLGSTQQRYRTHHGLFCNGLIWRDFRCFRPSRLSLCLRRLFRGQDSKCIAEFFFREVVFPKHVDVGP